MKALRFKPLAACLALLGMLLSIVSGCADAAMTRVLLDGMGQLKPVNKTRYLLAQDPKGTNWGIYNTDGERLMDYKYADLAYLAYDCFSASDKAPLKSTRRNPANPTLEYLNSHQLITANGIRITFPSYGCFTVYNHYWAAGWILREGTEEDYDYKYDNTHFYQIEKCDIYYLGDYAIPGSARRDKPFYCATLTREQFKKAQAHEKYLAIQDREDQVTYYDQHFEPVEMAKASLGTAAFQVRNLAVYKLDGTFIMAPFTDVREAQTATRMLLVASVTDYAGKKQTGVYTLDGEVLMPPQPYGVGAVTDEYAVLTNNGKQGLYSFKLGQQILPCMYDSVEKNNAGIDDYLLHGEYVIVRQKGVRYYAWLPVGGRIVRALETDKRGLSQKGCVATYTTAENRNRTTLVAADGYTHTTRHRYTAFRGDGTLIPFKFDANYGVMTWHGQEILKGCAYQVTMTDDNKIVCKTYRNGYRLLEPVWDAIEP